MPVGTSAGTLTHLQSASPLVCYEDLRTDTVLERSLTGLLRAETRDAVVNGVEAAALVVFVLAWQGTPALLVATSALLAVPLGALLHQAVLVVGAVVLRRRARRGGRTAQPR